MTHVHSGPDGWEGAAAHRIAHDETADGPSLRAGWALHGERLEAYADRLGMIPLFYWHDARRIVIGDAIGEVVARVPDVKLDPVALAVFMRLGFHIGERTPFEGVKVLPPGGRLVWEGGRISLSRPSLPIPAPFTGTLEQAVGRQAELFEHAIAKRTHSDVGRLPISGGRDSRHILFELLRQGHRPTALVTLDRPAHTDLEIGRLVAERVGIRHVGVSLRGSTEDELTKNRWNHYLTDENAWYVQILDHLEGPVFDGLAGSIFPGPDSFFAAFRGDELVQHTRKNQLADAARLLLAPRGDRTAFLSEPFRSRWSLDLAIEAVADELRLHRDAANPLMSFLFWNRTRREISLIPLAMAARRAPVRLPYLDDAVLQFLASLPYPPYIGTRLRDVLIERTYPQFAGIPYAAPRKRMRSPLSAVRVAVQALRFGLNPIVRRWVVAKSVAETVLTADTRAVAAWLYLVLPLVQASRELGVELKP